MKIEARFTRVRQERAEVERLFRGARRRIEGMEVKGRVEVRAREVEELAHII